MMGTSLDSEFVVRSESILAQLGFRDLKSFVKNQTLLMLMAKIDKYRTELNRFESKYGTDFVDFQKNNHARKDQESFEVEDDYLDWRFAQEALKKLEQQAREMEDA